MWTVLQHAAWESPGLIAAALDAHGLEPRIVRGDLGEAMPAAEAVRGLVIMGGPMGVYEAERHPFLKGELQLIGRCLAREIPMLGVCLGAQMLAAALGATVSKGPAMEAGEGTVVLTGAGRQDPVLGQFGTGELPVVHWHQDTFPLPVGAELLASSRMYEQQAFRAGPCIYGLQFHVELDAETAAEWRERGLSISTEHEQRVREVGEAVFDQFLHLAAACARD